MALEHIGIIGTGGVGGYFGAKLCRLLDRGQGRSVSFVARGEHLQAIQTGGLHLDSESDGEIVGRPTLATDDFRKLPRLDLGLICVKQYDLAAVLPQLRACCGDETVLLPLLNGVDIYVRVRSVISTGIVLPACVYVGTHVERPGKIVQRGGACKILFGTDPRDSEFSAHQLLTLFEEARIKAECSPNIQSEIWQKYIFICAFGLVSAAYDATLGQIFNDDRLTSDVQSIMDEVVSLAGRCDVSLPGDIVAASLAKGRGFPFDAKTSFQRDFERADKSDERDLFAGTMIRMAAEFGTDVPRMRFVSQLLDDRKPALVTAP